MIRYFLFNFFFVIASLFAVVTKAETVLSTATNIEITANDLEVDQIKKIAIFSGNVEAKKGEMKLKSDHLTAFYADKGSTNGSKGTISKILTKGNVVVTSKDQTAKGDQGSYDVDKEMLELNGSVVLIKGNNVVKGDRLIYNLKTGKSQVLSENNNSDEHNKKTNKGRVKAIFTPSKDVGKKELQ